VGVHGSKTSTRRFLPHIGTMNRSKSNSFALALVLVVVVETGASEGEEDDRNEDDNRGSWKALTPGTASIGAMNRIPLTQPLPQGERRLHLSVDARLGHFLSPVAGERIKVRGRGRFMESPDPNLWRAWGP
jgi:hypothetical protein